MTGQERNYGFMKLSELTAYELLGEQELKDIHSMGYILRHKKSGARITVISNDDENKVFYIGFRTPPEDSTGVPHIIEHTAVSYTHLDVYKRQAVCCIKNPHRRVSCILTWLVFPEGYLP